MYESVNAAAQHNPKEDNSFYDQKIHLSDCDGYITGHTIKGSHKTFIEGEGAEEVARLINNISFSELLPDMQLSRP
ncbi:hypothetical protein TNIN_179051 [Trichonephila inaurata madagascariensis]|uniref:Uncharacterized protein n=1 Tax=Trichonephila inaurata madagascariensis TaxID=2747483 RepID=A0A8X6XTL8_9ARAC|nr:hypothetical protein TNIN_179051 [Trichonephila inaurata madagascariensis]